MWYNDVMTKLQTLEAEIQTLPVEEQKELISKFTHLIPSADEDFFELTKDELAELDDRIANDTESFTLEEVLAELRKSI